MIGAIVLGFLSLVLGLTQWSLNKEAQEEANSDVMDFNSKEAEKSRDWQEEQYKKYESVAAQMQQRQQAGLTPYENITSMSVGSGATASTSANQISSLSLPDMSLFGQLAKDFTAAEGMETENEFQKEIFEKRKSEFDEQVRTLKLNNDQQEFWNKMFEQAHFNEDGTVKTETNTFLHEANKAKYDADTAQYQSQIAQLDKVFHDQEKFRNEFEMWLRNKLNVNFDVLPNHLKYNVTLFTWDIFTGKVDPDSPEGISKVETIYNSIASWHNEEVAIHSDEADGISSTVKDIEYMIDFITDNASVAEEALRDLITDNPTLKKAHDAITGENGNIWKLFSNW